MSEDRLQQDMYLWFHNKYPQLRGLLFHVPNGGARNAREGAKFKAMGVSKGVSDIIFLYNKTAYLIEIKTPQGRQSLYQMDWQKKVESNGFAYFIVKNLAEFQHTVENIISG